jgi:hypothetical protein
MVGFALFFKFPFAPNPTASVGETKWYIRVLHLDMATLACRRQRPLALFVIQKDPNGRLCSFFQISICSESNRSIGNANVHAHGYAQGAAGAPIFSGDYDSQETYLFPSPLTVFRIEIQRLPNSSAQRRTTLHPQRPSRFPGRPARMRCWETCMIADDEISWPTPAHHLFSNIRGEAADSNRNPAKRTGKLAVFWSHGTKRPPDAAEGSLQPLKQK